MDQPRYPYINVHLAGQSGNAGSIMGRVVRALRDDNVSQHEINEFRRACLSGDYNNLLNTVMEWVSVDEDEDES